MNYEIKQGDCLKVLRTLDDESVHCVLTSPPYFGLRDYGHDGQIGLEETPEDYVARIVEVFGELKRVLRDDGTAWLNIGDSYVGTHVTRERAFQPKGRDSDWVPSDNRKEYRGLPSKNLFGIPWRVAFALQEDGWVLRSDIIWAKPNPMPEPVTDRPTRSHEYLFLLSKKPRYFYDAEAIREEGTGRTGKMRFWKKGQEENAKGDRADAENSFQLDGMRGRNKRDVWHVSVKPFKGAHFAVFPPDLIEPCIKAGTSEKGACGECGAPWSRTKEGDWEPTCKCSADASSIIPCVVLDPFAGSGTTGVVSIELGRSFVGIELNPDYVKMARERLAKAKPRKVVYDIEDLW